MKAKLKDGEVNYGSISITMNLESGIIGIDNICTACILPNIAAFVV